MICWILALGACAAAAGAEVRGLPFTRSYALEEIGNVPRGARLGFDRFGRVAVIHDGVYTVLNDSAWLELADRDGASTGMVNLVQGADGRTYYGGVGAWGRVELTRAGKLRPQPLQPSDLPPWAAAATFTDVVATDAGVFFGGWGGVVFLDTRTGRSVLFELAGVIRLFAAGQRVFVSAHSHPLQAVDPTQGRLLPVADPRAGGLAVELAAPLDDRRVLLATRENRLWVFDGERASPWAGEARAGLTGRISSLHKLADGGIAVAIYGRGLFLLSAEGEVFCSLTAPEYHRIHALASREAGVLWAATEETVEKVLYGGPLTVFGQRLGLTVSWPLVTRWQDRILVASSGHLFAAIPAPPGSPSQFEPWPHQVTGGSWAMAASGGELLVGNPRGLFSLQADGAFIPLLTDIEVVRLMMVQPDLCYVVGREQITVLRWRDGRWAEFTPRIPAVGFPAVRSVVHGSRESVWLEFGGNRVVRLFLRDGQLRSQVFDSFPWPSQWVNVGIVDDIVVLTGPRGSRLFFDEKTGAFCEPAELQAMLAQCPHWVLRVAEDGTGVIWATHEQGVSAFVPTPEGYRLHSHSLELSNDRFPLLQLLPDNDVWVSTGQSLYRVDRKWLLEPRTPMKPVLVSMIDSRSNTEVLGGGVAGAAPFPVPFARNSLSFRFFSGTYAWRRPPAYEFRLHAGDERWTNLSAGSLLSLPGLREGGYRLEVRIASQGRNDPATALAFEVLPPWHRTWIAWTAYGLGAGLAIFGLVRWSSHRASRENLHLEQLVRARTDELKATMERLNEETRNAATLAERDRLAGEIHDSLQQGLSGLILQLDATLKQTNLADDVRARLNVARNMVSFTRHEVQHAVWDMESPLLADTELDQALRKLAELIGPGAASTPVSVKGTPRALPSAMKHHLLRIGQEAIANAVRHGSAKTIAITVEYLPDCVALAVADDGVGFHPEKVMANSVGHFGLRGVRGRAAKIGGDLRIESAPGRGTSIRIVVPAAGGQPPFSDDVDAARS